MNFSLLCRSRSTDLNLSVFTTVKELDAEKWNRVIGNENLYLSIPYLEALELAVDDGTEFRYLLLDHEQHGTVGVASVQIVKFRGSNSKTHDELCFLTRKIKDLFAGPDGFRVMTCGNVFSCGENGFAFTDDLPPEEMLAGLSDGLAQLQKTEKASLDSSLLLLKEFWPGSRNITDLFKNYKFRDFSADVNMVLNIHPSWNSMEDYLGSMQAKFRTKANAAFKRSAGLTVRSLTADEILDFSTDIDRLYLDVVKKSPYTFGTLNAKAFSNFKKYLGDHFILNAYFLEEQLVAFSSAFAFNGILDANYVGIEYELNQQYAIYPRMLYDFVELAIRMGSKELRLGRTAEEIKSSIGAVPVDMRLYVRHENSLSNKLIKPIIKSITPSDFELRKPFKVQFG